MSPAKRVPVFPIIRLMILLLLLLSVSAVDCLSQMLPDTLPAPTNVRPDGCPCILEDNRVVFQIKAPEADMLQIDIGGKLYEMERGEGGVWSVTTDPQDPGFHYYSLVIDGIRVADPASESFYGMGRMASGIDIPEEGVDFYDVRDVPHGEIRSRIYFSTTTGTWRKINTYTPPGYDQNTGNRYPVLYIQHGGGEDQRGWAVQGKTDLIMDNLIAEGKAVPMLVVIGNGNAGQSRNLMGYTDEAMEVFREELLDNIIPFVESNYRALTGPGNRALAGLSMGGGQSFFTGLRNTGTFAWVGTFSTGLYGGIGRGSVQEFDPEEVVPGILTDPQTFNRELELFYISVGEQDQRYEHTRLLVQKFRDHGLEVEFASFPGDHEWQVWRKSLHDFAQKLFK